MALGSTVAGGAAAGRGGETLRVEDAASFPANLARWQLWFICNMVLYVVKLIALVFTSTMY